MANYDRRVSDAKHNATEALLGLGRVVGNTVDGDAMHNMAWALDELNKAWDELTDCLVRQREERGRQILSLIDELAESKK